MPIIERFKMTMSRNKLVLRILGIIGGRLSKSRSTAHSLPMTGGLETPIFANEMIARRKYAGVGVLWAKLKY
jgi:hypothetical protein